MVFNKRTTYPNMFVMLIGKPGTGKTTAMTEVYNLLSYAGVKLAPKSSSSQALYDVLAQSLQSLSTPNGQLIFSSLSIVVDELAVWMPMYDNSLMGLLCTIWDNPHKHSQVLRTKEIKPIENPSANMLVGVQPAYLGSILPPTAHEQGILARCIMVYTGEVVKYKLSFGEAGALPDEREFQVLLAGLKRIKNMIGTMGFSKEAEEVIREFYDQPPLLEDARFQNYNARRLVFVAKLSMIACASLSNNLTIEAAHVIWAINTLKDTEIFMPEVYKEMKKPESAKIMADCYAWIRTQYNKTKKPIPGHRIIHLLNENTTAYEVKNLFQQMLDMKMIKEVSRSSSTSQLAIIDKCYIPVAEHDRDTA